MNRRLGLVLVLLLQFSVSCTGTVGTATLLSTRPIDPAALGRLEVSSKAVTGEVKVWVYVVFHKTFSLDAAIEDALRKVPGAVALTDVTIYDTFWWAGLIGRGGFVVEGKPLIDPLRASDAAPLNDLSPRKVRKTE